jgi:hypothetical protein
MHLKKFVMMLKTTLVVVVAVAVLAKINAIKIK